MHLITGGVVHGREDGPTTPTARDKGRARWQRVVSWGGAVHSREDGPTTVTLTRDTRVRDNA